ncbi:concanavalin A-like lectin/glucanase domain-containing protein [Sordaria brevicollis]|uniref:Glucanase n=1 Tax=Sordaria brevicollis TaxID=83679 RepID=A0AAE0PHQ5_SORBR|nr:concanavalin A-like lectin/glucanase domain-containing protein [Sordaria brevicollis]
MSRKTLLSALLVTAVSAQQAGKLSPEVHPKLPTWECTVAGGCVEKDTSLVLDSDYRWVHTDDYTNCKINGLNPAVCPDAETCAANCKLEGVDYAGSGIHVDGSELTLNLFVNRTDGTTSLVSPRVYLLANETTYDMFSLLDKEFTFDVDVSKLPCGTNGALYFSEMLANGGKSSLNPAGASYGTGYCDAQCPTPAFINGEANLESYGACCNEMDIWEANSRATAFTPHPCNVTALYKCSGALCGRTDKYQSVCDKDGCDYNPYRLGDHPYYGRGEGNKVDTTRPFTVVTQFFSNTTAAGEKELSSIKRLYLQDGKLITTSTVNVPGYDSASDTITDEFCAKNKQIFGGVNAFANQGGLRQMGEALGRGMVLVFSVWHDAGSAMKWLDGTFLPEEGHADDIQRDASWTEVRFSNVKSGEIGSTFAVANTTVNIITMTLIKLPSSLSDEAKKNPTLKGHKLVILTPWAPTPGYIESIQSQFPDLIIEYHPSQWTQTESPFPIDEWKDVTIALTFTYLPQPKDAPNLKYLTNSPQISEWLILTYLSFNHRLPHYLSLQRQAHWSRGNFDSIEDATAKTVGILGYGAIGRQTARLATAMGMRVHAYTLHPRPTPESKKDHGWAPEGMGDPDGVFPTKWFSGGSKSDLHTFLGSGLDLLVVSTPLTPGTKHLLGKEEFDILYNSSPPLTFTDETGASSPRGRTFVSNIARGPVINTDDLIEALESGKIRGAALDVTDPEPLPDGHKLWSTRNVILTPHVSGASTRYNERVLAILRENLGRLGEGRRLVNGVSRREGY